MQFVKNFIVGFAISLVGSLPLGYINLIAARLDQIGGGSSLFPFLMGVVLVEYAIILLMLNAASWLLRQKKMVKNIEMMSIIFMVFLAITFFYQNKPDPLQTPNELLIQYSPFLLGIFFNSINLMQLPFWAGWNIYLIHETYIDVRYFGKYVYVLGTSVGTFTGIFLFVRFLNYLLNTPWLSGSPLANSLIPMIFLSLAGFQSFKFYKKYYSPDQG